MKFNLILIFVLIGLGVFTYFFEEIGQEEKRLKSDAMSRLIEPGKLGNIIGVKGGAFNLVSKGEDFVTSREGLLISRSAMTGIFNILSTIKVKRIIDESEIKKLNREEFFLSSDPFLDFKFESGELTYTLGKPLSFTNQFYMEIKKSSKSYWVVAYDDSASEKAYQIDQNSYNNQKYKRLSSLFSLKESILVDSFVFNQKWESIESIKIQNIRNRDFEVLVKSKKTSPKRPLKIDFNEAQLEDYIKDVRALKGESITYPYNKKDLSDSVSVVTLSTESRKYRLELFKKYKGLSGYYLSSQDDKRLFKISNKSARVFFFNVQDFWIKRISNLSSAKITFQNKTSFELEKLKGISKLLSSEAFRVNKMSFHTLKNKVFDIQTSKFKWSAYHEDPELILYNEESQTGIHYLIGKQLPFSVDYKKYEQK